MRTFGARFLPVFILLASSLAPHPAQARIIDGVVAVVNDEPVTFSEVRDAAAEGLGIPVGDADLYLREERETARVLHWIEALVESVLVRQELARSGNSVTDKEVDRALESVRKGNNMSEAEFSEAMAKEGVSMAGYRRRVRWQMERGSLVRAKRMKDVNVTEEELRTWFQENAERFLAGAEVRMETLHIPIPAEGREEERVVRQRIAAQQASEYVRLGRTFTEVAELLSPAFPGISASESGFVKTEDLMPEIQKEVKRLRTGERSQPVFIESGAYLLSVLGRRGGTPEDFSAVRESISDEVTDRRSEKALADIMNELRKASAIDVRL